MHAHIAGLEAEIGSSQPSASSCGSGLGSSPPLARRLQLIRRSCSGRGELRSWRSAADQCSKPCTRQWGRTWCSTRRRA